MFRTHHSIRWTTALHFASVSSLAVSLACSGGGSSSQSSSTVNKATAPVITQQPGDQTAMAGDAVTFSVVASGSPAPNYQWRKGGTSIQGQNGAQLILGKVQPSDEDTYDVLVSNSASTVTSTAAALTVNRRPAFTQQPANQQVLAPAAATFTVVVDGKPAPQLQWESSTSGGLWSPISGATTATYTTGATNSGQNGNQYHCVATSGAETVTSQAATLLVNTGASYTLTVNLGQGVTGTPSASGPYAKAASVPYNFSALSGYSNLQVSLDGKTAPATGTVVMDGNHALAATATVNSHKVTFVAGSGGAITGTLIQTVADGQDATPVTAVPSAGKAFANWTGAGFTTSTTNPLTVAKVTQDETITANFTNTPSTYTVTFTAGTGGTLSGSAVQSVTAGGDAQAVTAVPSTGMGFVNWTGAGFTASTTNPLTVTKVSQNLALTANFTAIPTDTGYNVGQTAADISFINAAGKASKLSDYKGKVILLVCSEVYCDPCRTESKILQSIQDQYGPQGLVIIENLSDFGTHKVTSQDMVTWASDGGLTTVPVTHDTNDVPTLCGITGFPTNFIIGRDFKVKTRQVGYSEYTVRNMVAQGMK